MGRAFSDIAFTPTVRGIQSRFGSRGLYESWDQATERRDQLSGREMEFLASADHFFQATVGETGWPYVQHRGGPAGFLRVLDDKTIGYADFKGNRQYISVGNLSKDDRVAWIVMDYARRQRLKVLGRARIVEAADDPGLIERMRVPGYGGAVERVVLVNVEAWDWNCPQHITPRFTAAEIEEATEPLRARILELETLLENSTATQGERL